MEEEEEEMKHSIAFGFLPCSWEMHISSGPVFIRLETLMITVILNNIHFD